jgi:hypothetical protein
MGKKHQELWAICPHTPLGNRPLIRGPLIFDSLRQARAFLYSASVIVYDGWGRGEEKNFESRADWLKEIADLWVGQPSRASSNELFRSDLSMEEIIATQARQRDEALTKLSRRPVSTAAVGVPIRPGVDVYLCPFPKQVRVTTGNLIAFPLPVHSLRADGGAPCALRLAEFSAEELIPVPTSDIQQLIAMSLLEVGEEFGFCLHRDWHFPTIRRDALSRKWHRAPSYKIGIANPRHHFWRIVLEIEASLHNYHANLSASSLRAFWISWQLSLHLCEVKRQVEQYAELPGAVAGEKHHIAEALTAVESNLRSYIRELEREVIRHRRSRPLASQLASGANERASGDRTRRKANAAPQAGEQRRVRPGPKRVLASAGQVSVIVIKVAGSQLWKSKLEDICEALDDEKIPLPTTWPHRETPLTSWSDAWVCEPDLAKKAINYRLKIARS